MQTSATSPKSDIELFLLAREFDYAVFRVMFYELPRRDL